MINKTQKPVSGAMTDAEIREVFLANGFKLNGEDANGKPDLRPYVYQAARALISRAQDAQAVRNAALEEAAQVCNRKAEADRMTKSGRLTAVQCAGLIRLLQSAPAQPVERPDGKFLLKEKL